MTRRALFRVFLISLLLVIPLGIYLAPDVVAAVISVVALLAPVWLPIALAVIFLPLWLLVVRSNYAASVPYVIFEMIPGEHTPKTARAMELVFYSLHHRTSISRATEFLTGAMRLPWSFEIAATGGVVRFFMRIPKSHRQAVELRMRSEYQDIDLNECRDYARELDLGALSMDTVMREFTLEKPDPYPLKTYETYEANKEPDPYQKLLERLVTFGEGEHLFISYIVRPHQRARSAFFKREVDTLHTDAYDEIARLVGEGGDPRTIPLERQHQVAAIEEGLKKPPFECGARVLYAAPREIWSDTRVDEVMRLFEAFADPSLNNLVPYNPNKKITWPLSDLFSTLPFFEKLYFLHLYRRRAFFTPPYYGTSFILNTAELATLFHLPHITRSSTLARSRGRRLEPPENLPIGSMA